MVDGGGGLAWAVTGALLVSVRPRNVLSLLILAEGVALTGSMVSGVYANYAGVAPIGTWALYVSTILGLVSANVPLTVLLAFYPEGRLAGPLWWLPLGGSVLGLVLFAIALPSVISGRGLFWLFKVSVHLQGGPKRAAYAAAWARVRRLAGAHDGHAGSPSAGVHKQIGPRRRQAHRW